MSSPEEFAVVGEQRGLWSRFLLTNVFFGSAFIELLRLQYATVPVCHRVEVPLTALLFIFGVAALVGTVRTGSLNGGP